ncbi:MAG TPA: hypothetical protein DCX77_08660, partial [Acidimicrobiaceae bacterium]|nr:hypothetical protein [Acidimicrobiaceae bacterium]
VIASMYAVWHGPHGLKNIAERIHLLTANFAKRLDSAGIVVVNKTFFDTVTIQVPNEAADITQRALD